MNHIREKAAQKKVENTYQKIIQGLLNDNVLQDRCYQEVLELIKIPENIDYSDSGMNNNTNNSQATPKVVNHPFFDLIIYMFTLLSFLLRMKDQVKKNVSETTNVMLFTFRNCRRPVKAIVCNEEVDKHYGPKLD